MKISPEVIDVLTGLTIDGHFVKIEQQLDRKLYLDVNKVLEACGGEWNRKAKAHLFDGDANARIEQAIVTGDVTTDQDLGFFPTPSELARELVRMADVRPGQLVLEPSAGAGAIVDYIVGAGAGCIAIERDPRRRDALIGKVMAIHDWTASVHVVRDCDDFLGYEPDGPLDRVVMNPPFCKVGRGDHLDHVRYAWGMLGHDGVLVSVLPAGVLFRQDRRHREFREWAESIGGAIVKLPSGSFKASGTGVEACTLVLTRAS